ncbi:MAG: RdgB/HAM1 family non-canonical purine NTP pyrophosphatase [Bryobacterales bacterium]|nr:RdgB/HAM1 family non-canonical purine NTP pyrophosphatase [Bryobacterales bacterium]
MILHCATTNAGKLREFRAAAGHWGFPEISIESLPGLKSIEPPLEHGTTFEANATDKAMYYSRYSPECVFADDSGLVVDALGGAPGVYSARYAGPDARDSENLNLLLERLEVIDERSARFECVVALAKAGGLLATFRGTVQGRITRTARGSNGFGYDPVFYYEPFGCTFGEAGEARKLDVSHRGQALRAMLTWCRESLSSDRSR